MKNKKLLVTVVVLAVAVLGVAGFYMLSGGEDNTGVAPVVTTGKGFPATEADAVVYAVIEQYLNAQIGSDRSAVTRMLSGEHLAEWTDSSFLVNDNAFELFDEIKLENLKMSVIDFNRREGKDLAAVMVSYSVTFMKDDKVEASVNLEEELGLGRYAGEWLIDKSLRNFLAQN